MTLLRVIRVLPVTALLGSAIVVLPVNAAPVQIAQARDTGRELVQQGLAETLNISDLALRMRTVLAIADIQAEADWLAGARDTFGQVIAASEQIPGGSEQERRSRQLDVLLTTAGIQCQNGLLEDARATRQIAEEVAGNRLGPLLDVADAHERCGDPQGAARLLQIIAAGGGGVEARALASKGFLEAAMAVARELEDPAEAAQTYTVIGGAARQRGADRLAGEAFVAARNASQQLADPAEARRRIESLSSDPDLLLDTFVTLLNEAGWLTRQQQWAQASQRVSRASMLVYQAFSARGLTGAEVDPGIARLVDAYGAMRDFEAAQDWLSRIKTAAVEAQATASLTEAAALGGNLDLARRLVQRLRDAERAQGLLAIAEAEAALGQPDSARAHQREALDLVDKLPEGAARAVLTARAGGVLIRLDG